MAGIDDPYVNEHGVSLFERALTAYDLWLDGIPCVNSGANGVEAYAQRQLVRDVWPAVEQLCIRLEANGKSELASRIERGFRDVEDYARIIDDYCQSERFDFELWQYGDPALNMQYEKDGEPSTLSAKAEKIAIQPVRDLDSWCYRRQWARELGEQCEGAEIEKYGHAPTEDYVEYVARWAWACFWLAAQLRHCKLDHHKACSHLECLLSPLCLVSETKYPVIHEALGRAYGMRIYSIAPMESEEVRRVIESFGAVITETRLSLSMAAADAAGDQASAQPAGELPVTLFEFMRQYCRGSSQTTRSFLHSRRTAIQNAAQAGTIALPPHVGQWKRGKSKYYRPGDLAARWPKYSEAIADLPALKPRPPKRG